jgi:hypothetical protein
VIPAGAVRIPSRRTSRGEAASLTVYAAALLTGASSAVVALVLSHHTFANLWVVLVLALAAAAAERQTAAINSSTEMSIGLLPTLLAAVVFGPLAALLISAASMLTDLRPQEKVPLPYLRWISTPVHDQ